MILSKKQLVDYLKLALERVHERKEVQLESARREELASGSQGENPGNDLDTDPPSGADVTEDAAQSSEGRNRSFSNGEARASRTTRSYGFA